jgi:hypothetical protein
MYIQHIIYLFGDGAQELAGNVIAALHSACGMGAAAAAGCACRRDDTN